jgi:D-3-phosphoglycerate dehydrogenase
VDSPVREVRIDFAGEMVEFDAAPVTRAFLAGLLRDVSARVNVVNAFMIAEERRIAVTTSYRRGSEMVQAIQSRVVCEAGEQTASGTVFGIAGGGREGRITEINGFRIEAIPRGHMLVMHNRDVPGVIGRVGTILGERGINISEFHLGRRERGGEAMAVIEIDAPLDRETIDDIRNFAPVVSARQIEL